MVEMSNTRGYALFGILLLARLLLSPDWLFALLSRLWQLLGVATLDEPSAGSKRTLSDNPSRCSLRLARLRRASETHSTNTSPSLQMAAAEARTNQ